MTPSLILRSWVAHTHTVRSRRAVLPLSDIVRTIRQRGVDYLSIGSPWDEQDLIACEAIERDASSVAAFFAQPDCQAALIRSDRFAEWSRRFSDGTFLLDVENESPKGRYGHLCWLGWHPDAPFFFDYDQPFEFWMRTDRSTPPPPYARRPMAAIVDRQQARGALGIAVHPTSWWTDDRGRFVTNIAAELPLLLATGHAPDALAVMGYDADHAGYQALWHDWMGRGFYLPGVAELDWCLDNPAENTRPFLHNLVRLGTDERWSPSLLKGKIRAGATIMTSGPRLWTTCNGRDPGSEIRASEAAELTVTFPQAGPTVVRLELTRNGRVFRSFPLKSRTETARVHLPDERDGIWIVKAYGMNPRTEVAITNPFFVGRSRRPARRSALPLPGNYLEALGETLDYLALGKFRQDFPSLAPGIVPPAAFPWDAVTKRLARLIP